MSQKISFDAMSAHCIKNVINYLNYSSNSPQKSVKIPTNSLEPHNFNPVLLDLCRKDSELAPLVGRTELERALVFQWLEYNVLNVWNSPVACLQELDSAILNTAYFAGTRVTIADIILYYSLHPIIKELNFFDKEKFCNLSRWFGLMQADEKVRLSNSKVVFSVVPLYSGLSHC